MTPVDLTVSVIVPAYNSADSLAVLLHKLSLQTYPVHLIEVIVVDNNSTDETHDICCKFDCVYIKEKRQGSYAARNAGIKAASGDVVAFIDADCVPCLKWLEMGMKCLIDSGLNVVAGDVEFECSTSSKSAIYDSAVNIQAEFAVKIRKLAMTANLFVNRSVFSSIGLFDEDALSGSDLVFTSRVSDTGLGLGYCSQAKVYHPTRSLRGLIKKAWRTSLGKKYWTGRRLQEVGLSAGRLRNPLSRKLINPVHMASHVMKKYPDIRVVDILGIYMIHIFLISVSLLSRLIGR